MNEWKIIGNWLNKRLVWIIAIIGTLCIIISIWVPDQLHTNYKWFYTGVILLLWSAVIGINQNSN